MSLIERTALSLRFLPGYCPICGLLTVMGPWHENLRETGCCRICKSINRQRQITYVLLEILSESTGSSMRRLSDLNRVGDLSIYNAEASGGLHFHLSNLVGYVFSEYFGPNYAPGEFVDGIRHENILDLTFPDCNFDVVLTSEVFEHIPSPYQAHEEVWRVLKPGGHHIFTVPFYQTRYLDDVLAEVGQDGESRFLQKPVYHADPLRPEGILVYTIFSLEMLIKLRSVGFRTYMYRLYRPSWGILGLNGIVFDAVKQV
jgi:SAM-dependent methyltransferase